MKTAIFYDLENIGLASKNGKYAEDFHAAQKRIKSSPLVGQIILQKAYMRNTSHLPQIEPILQKLGVDLTAVAPISNKHQAKIANMVDFKMGLDAISTIARRHSIQTVVIASGDNDFGFLCQQIKDMGKNLLIASRFSITGDALATLCDDWIDLSPETAPLKPAKIKKIIDARITGSYEGQDFTSAFTHFINTMIQDNFIRRYLTNFGLPLFLFVNLLHERKIKPPCYKTLGFSSSTALAVALLQGSGFQYRGDTIFYTGEGAAFSLSQERLTEKIIELPSGYSTKKLLHYHDILSKVENIEELTEYIVFMKRSGVIQNNTLCYKPTFRATISKYLCQLLKKAGIAPSQNAIKEILEKL